MCSKHILFRVCFVFAPFFVVFWDTNPVTVIPFFVLETRVVIDCLLTCHVGHNCVLPSDVVILIHSCTQCSLWLVPFAPYTAVWPWTLWWPFLRSHDYQKQLSMNICLLCSCIYSVPFTNRLTQRDQLSVICHSVHLSVSHCLAFILVDSFCFVIVYLFAYPQPLKHSPVITRHCFWV